MLTKAQQRADKANVLGHEMGLLEALGIGQHRDGEIAMQR